MGKIGVPAKPWTTEQVALLEKLKREGVDFREIAPQVGHSAGSCATTLSQIKRQRREAEAAEAGEVPQPPPRGRPVIHAQPKPWNARDIGIAARIWQQDYADHYDEDEAPRGVLVRVMNRIAAEIGCEYARVHQRHRDCGPSFISGGHRKDLTAQALADRDKRKMAADLRTITGHVMGDPPPGYSALDRRPRR